MFTVYVLRSKVTQRYYVGHSKNSWKRLHDHNDGKVRSTKAYRPWEIIYTECYDTKNEAFKREREIKSYKGGEAFKKLIKSEGCLSGCHRLWRDSAGSGKRGGLAIAAAGFH